MPDLDTPINPGDRDGYDAIPDYIISDIRLYVKHGQRGGHFIEKLMSGDYMAALGHADDQVLAGFTKLMRYMYNRVPGACFGSKLNYDIWTCVGGEKNFIQYDHLINGREHTLSKETVMKIKDIHVKDHNVRIKSVEYAEALCNLLILGPEQLRKLQSEA